MMLRTPAVGLIFLVGLALITVAAGYYTVFLPAKSSCPAIGQTYNITVVIHQWYFDINGTDATKSGWSICHGSTVTFVISGMWEHNADINGNYSAHGFYMPGLMSQPVIVNGQDVKTTQVSFDVPAGDYTLECTIPCGAFDGFGGHPILTTIHVL